MALFFLEKFLFLSSTGKVVNLLVRSSGSLLLFPLRLFYSSDPIAAGRSSSFPFFDSRGSLLPTAPRRNSLPHRSPPPPEPPFPPCQLRAVYFTPQGGDLSKGPSETLTSQRCSPPPPSLFSNSLNFSRSGSGATDLSDGRCSCPVGLPFPPLAFPIEPFLFPVLLYLGLCGGEVLHLPFSLVRDV